MCLTRRCLSIGENSPIETFDNRVDDWFGCHIIDFFLSWLHVENSIKVEVCILIPDFFLYSTNMRELETRPLNDQYYSTYLVCLNLKSWAILEFNDRLGPHGYFFLIKWSETTDDRHISRVFRHLYFSKSILLLCSISLFLSSLSEIINQYKFLITNSF